MLLLWAIVQVVAFGLRWLIPELLQDHTLHTVLVQRDDGHGCVRTVQEAEFIERGLICLPVPPTGICNSLLFLLPWASTHPTFRAIGAAFLILDIALFLFFSFLTIARYTMYPAIFPAMLSHPVHSLFLGTIPMGLVTIVSGIALQGDAYGLSGSVEAAAGLWWVSLVLSGISAFGVPLAMQTTHNHTGESLTAAWLLPIVPPITVAATGSTIASLLTPTQPDYALTIWIASYFMAGVGCLLAAMVLVLYFQRLALHHMPGREVVVTTFCESLSVSRVPPPCAMTKNPRTPFR